MHPREEEALERATSQVRDDPPNDAEPIETIGEEQWGFRKGWEAARSYYLALDEQARVLYRKD